MTREYGSGETDTTSCMCGARTGLVGTFAGSHRSSSVELKVLEGSLSSCGESENAHSVERFLCQGAYGADLSLHEIDVALEECRRVGVVWL